jgi:hypothetical protein
MKHEKVCVINSAPTTTLSKSPLEEHRNPTSGNPICHRRKDLFVPQILLSIA